MMNGTIKRIVSDKGFGFILASDGMEYFFHNSACQGIRSMTCAKGRPSLSSEVRVRRAPGPRA